MSEHVSPRLTAKDIFLRAQDLPADERSAFVDTACDVDTALRARVQALLDAEANVGDVFLEGDAHRVHSAAGSHAPLDESGRQIGPYKLIEVIGEGGFGTVYLAEQEHPVRRRVALKLIKLGMDTKQVIARFEAERQALAMMDHPNIARVFDAGAASATANGLPGGPFFV